MKSKKLLGFISAIMGVCLSVTSFVTLTAFAEETNIPYQVKAGAVQECLFVHNSLADYFETTDGKAIDIKKVASVVVTHDTDGVLTEGTHYDFDKSKGTILFGKEGLHDVKVKFVDESLELTLTKEDIDVVTKSEVTDLLYNIDSAKILEFNSKVQDAITALDADATSVAIPDEFWSYVYSKVVDKDDNTNISYADVFGKNNYRTKVYVSAPKGGFSVVSSSWSTSLSKINLSSTGTYYFYVEVKDPCYNEIVKSSDYKLKADGWYKETTPDDPATPDVDESEYNELVIPVFSFTYTKPINHKVEIETKVKEGIVGQEYTYIKATVSEDSNNTEVKLFYNPSITDKLPNAEGATGWVEVVNGEQAEYTSLTKDSTKFTPLAKGSFCIYIESRGGASGYEIIEAYSEIVVVNREITQQKLVNDKFAKFMKNNWLSVVFLGIALLCIVGIIILAFYKPKDETPAPKKKETIEDAEEIVNEEVEDVTDAEVEEVVDASEETEEATEEVEEAVEETETPSEEVATEEVSDGENA